MEPDATNKATSDTIPHECVRKDRTYDISTGSSRITGDKKGLETIISEIRTIIPYLIDWKPSIVQISMYGISVNSHR